MFMIIIAVNRVSCDQNSRKAVENFFAAEAFARAASSSYNRTEAAPVLALRWKRKRPEQSLTFVKWWCRVYYQTTRYWGQ